MSPFNVTWLQNFQTRIVTENIIIYIGWNLWKSMVLSMKNPWIFIRIQIPKGVFRVMIKHLLIISYYYHHIKPLNVTLKSHVYSKFSNSVSDMFYSDRESCNIYRVD